MCAEFGQCLGVTFTTGGSRAPTNEFIPRRGPLAGARPTCHVFVRRQLALCEFIGAAVQWRRRSKLKPTLAERCAIGHFKLDTSKTCARQSCPRPARPLIAGGGGSWARNALGATSTFHHSVSSRRSGCKSAQNWPSALGQANWAERASHFHDLYFDIFQR